MTTEYFANPYKPNTQLHDILEALKDLEWHCGKCDLPGTQPAKPLQLLRQDGWKFDGANGRWERRMHCSKCKRATSHRRLISLEKDDTTVRRAGISKAVHERIRRYYFERDELLGYAPTGKKAQVDHRIPQVRWTTDETLIPDDISDAEIEQRFMLLIAEHNLLKSRSCERCKRTGQRQPLLEIEFFYVGDSTYDPAVGCRGCGWYNPREWKNSLNARLLGKHVTD